MKCLECEDSGTIHLYSRVETIVTLGLEAPGGLGAGGWFIRPCPYCHYDDYWHQQGKNWFLII